MSELKEKSKFQWSKFYEAIADALYKYKENRSPLIKFIHTLGLGGLEDQIDEKTKKPLADICPFTVMALFNKSTSDIERKKIATALAKFLKVKEACPESFEEIPKMLPHNFWFFGYKYKRQDNDIDVLWDVFAKAIEYHKNNEETSLEELSAAYDKALDVRKTKWNLSIGLFWIRPWDYLSLDSNSQEYIKGNLGLEIKKSRGVAISAVDYMDLMERLKEKFADDSYSVHSFPELSLEAYRLKNSNISKDIAAFKEVFPDFKDFENPGKKYLEQERHYKEEAANKAKKIFAKLNNNFDNSVDIYLEILKLGNFYNWRDQDHIREISNSNNFKSGLKRLFKAVKENNIEQAVFEKISEELQNANLAPNMFLQTVLFPFFLLYPQNYFAMKSRFLLTTMQYYDCEVYREGKFLNYDQFMKIQEFASDIKKQLSQYKPKDMIDVQSFLFRTQDSKSDDEQEESNNETSNRGEKYTIKNIIEDGCFIKEKKLEDMLERLQYKKNLILQGPPGTGKTWLAKRLAFALMGEKTTDKILSQQFHPNLSYEDFVIGFRPNDEGKLLLEEGPFLEMARKAKADPESKYVFVIEEINRGNPSQILGEMLTLLEADKRDKTHALRLAYSKEEVCLPENLYVIGTMNLADRSLAMLDFALRRRFAFIDLEPQLNDAWKNYVSKKNNIDKKFLTEIQKRIDNLNQEIEDDSDLGSQYKIGHSYITPPNDQKIHDTEEWFTQIVDTEIYPLLEEYWFSSPETAKEKRDKLLKDI